MAAPWAHRYAQRTKSAKSSIIRELLKLTQRPEVISFAGGLPAPEVFPVARFQEACQRVLQTQAATALQYGPTEGYRPLRELIVAHMVRYGILANVDNVLITSGSQQALDLIAKLLINRGDRILVESPTYLGALQAFDLMGAEYVSVPIDDHGMQTCDMEHALRSGRSLCTSCRTSKTRAESRSRANAAISWWRCRTNTASRSLKTIPTGSFVTKASTSRRWWCWTAPISLATAATSWATLFT